MKNLQSIENYDLSLLTNGELKEIQGGYWKEITFWLLSEFDDIKQGVKDSLDGKEYDYKG